MQTVLLIIHVLVSIALIVFVLLQQGRGADAGAAFGSGASSTVFGSRGSASFMTRATAVLAATFFLSSLWLAQMTLQQSRESRGSLMPAAEAPAPGAPTSVQPAAPSDVPALPAQNPPAGDAPKP